MKKLLSRCIHRKTRSQTRAAPASQKQSRQNDKPPVELDTGHDLPATDTSEPPDRMGHESLWDEAYDALKCESSEMVDRSQELSASITPIRTDSIENMISGDPHLRQKQFTTISKEGLMRMDAKKLEYTIAGHRFVLHDQITHAANLVM
ncbi:hypothetical protein QQZ08_000410 [Neonectria magnoliae]|uniref:NWD NACHT-NTPase N-terminal domain-containing protein n=1 Tax=Neonectria magnoliae TaxID=2732573 RepID=A0ABR1IH92_9HYPO